MPKTSPQPSRRRGATEKSGRMGSFPAICKMSNRPKGDRLPQAARRAKAKPSQKLLRRLGHPHKELRVCYEAGPCGFVLARRLKQWGIACDVARALAHAEGRG
jgi:hypothetical protein